MTVDTTSPRSRRALLAGSLGGLAALAAQAVGRPLPAAAAGSAVLLGQDNISDGPYTGIESAGGSSQAAFALHHIGVYGANTATDGFGVEGWSTDTHGNCGVHGLTSGHSSQVAVLADTTPGNGEGYAVKALTKNGIAVYAECTGGAAIVANGVTEFSRSGKASFSAGQVTRTLTVGRIAADTLVVATVQSDVGGTWVRNVTVSVPHQNFTIRLNRAAPKALKVGWFVVN